jgi:phage replication O-like protein O
VESVSPNLSLTNASSQAFRNSLRRICGEPHWKIAIPDTRKNPNLIDTTNEYQRTMTNSEKKKGFTMIPNDELESVTGGDFTKRELKILLYIFRNGYGYNKRRLSKCKRDVGRIAKNTGIDRSHVNATIRDLIAKKVIKIEQGYILFIWLNEQDDAVVRDGEEMRPKQPREKAKTASEESKPKQPREKAKTTSKESRPKQPQNKAETATDCGQNSLVGSCNMVTDSELPSPKENRKEKRNPHTPTNGGVLIDDSFNQIWKIYPKKVSKAAAKKAFQKIKPNKELFDTMINAIEAQKRSHDWIKDDGQFIPYLSTWLNKARWEDELETTTAQTAFGFE